MVGVVGRTGGWVRYRYERDRTGTARPQRRTAPVPVRDSAVPAPARLTRVRPEAVRASDDVLWVFGHAASELPLVGRFDEVFLLEIDQRAMISAGSAAVFASYTDFVGWRGTGRPASTPPATSRPSRRNCCWPSRWRPCARTSGETNHTVPWPDSGGRPDPSLSPLSSQNADWVAYRSIMTEEELAAAVDGREGWRLEGAAAIYVPPEATAHVRVQAMGEPSQTVRFAAAIVRGGHAEHTRPAATAVEAVLL
jgi:hypothetical protein